MSLFSALTKVWDVGWKLPGAVIAARAALETGRGPLVALRTFAQATEGQLATEAADELEAALRTSLLWLHTATGVLALAADPTVVGAIDRTLHALVDLGFHVGSWRATIAVWLEE